MAVDITDKRFIDELVARERAAQHTGGRWVVLPILLLTVLFLAPFYYLIVTVFKSTPEYARKGVLELPDSLAPFVDNVVQAWTIASLGNAAANSFSYAVVGAALAVGFAAAAAYGMTRLKLLGANGWFMLIFTGTLFPFQMYLVPLLFGYQRLGLVNTWFGML
ncbi:MAG TPA: hypothetical protein VFE52_04075, partial [Devosia sp.]|nr:hypothetical protein [Devosia sp.]